MNNNNNNNKMHRMFCLVTGIFLCVSSHLEGMLCYDQEVLHVFVSMESFLVASEW